MRRAASIAVVVGLFLCAQAQAVTLVTPDGQVARPYQRWADRSAVPTGSGAIIVHNAQCPQQNAIACFGGGAPWAPRTIYSPSDDGQYVFFHELGHAFDQAVLGGAGRASYSKITAEAAPEYSEAFADQFAYCALGSWPDPRSRFTHRRVCALVKRTARRAG